MRIPVRLPSPRCARLIARTELRRRRRRLYDNTRRLVGIGIGALLGGLYVLGLVVGAYLFGAALRAGDGGAIVAFVRTGIGSAVVLGTAFVTYWTIVGRGSLDEPAALLTARPYYDVAAGVLLAEYLQVLLVAGLPIVAIAAAFALGAASPLSFLVVSGTLLVALACVLCAGYAIGVGAKNVAARSRLVARYKTVLWVLAFGVYLVVIFGVSGGTGSSFVGSLFGVFGATPLGWLADLALVAAPGLEPNPVRVFLAAGSLAVSLPVAFASAIVLSGWLWYVDPVQPDRSGRERSTPKASVAEGVLGGAVPRPTLAVATKSWRRALRAPLNLQYVLFPLFFAYVPLQGILESGTVPPSAPVVIAIYGAWTTGAAFTLNPFGDEGAVLPLTLTSAITGRRFVNGLVLAGVALGAPFTAAATLVAGLLSPLGTIAAIVAGVFGGVLCVGAAAMAVGIGAAYPKFERSRLSRSRRAVVPSLSAFALYSVALLFACFPGAVVQSDIVVGSLAGSVGTSQAFVAFLGPTVTAVLVVVGAGLGYRRAVRGFEGYTT